MYVELKKPNTLPSRSGRSHLRVAKTSATMAPLKPPPSPYSSSNYSSSKTYIVKKHKKLLTNKKKPAKRFMNICSTHPVNSQSLQPRRSLLMATMRKRNAQILKRKRQSTANPTQSQSFTPSNSQSRHRDFGHALGRADGHGQNSVFSMKKAGMKMKVTKPIIKMSSGGGVYGNLTKRLGAKIGSASAANTNSRAQPLTRAGGGGGGGGAFGGGGGGGVGRVGGDRVLKKVYKRTTHSIMPLPQPLITTLKSSRKISINRAGQPAARLRGGEERPIDAMKTPGVLYIVQDEKVRNDNQFHAKKAIKRLKFRALQAKAATIEKRCGNLTDARQKVRILPKSLGAAKQSMPLQRFMLTQSRTKSSKLHFFYNMGQKQQQQQQQQQQLQQKRNEWQQQKLIKQKQQQQQKQQQALLNRKLKKPKEILKNNESVQAKRDPNIQLGEIEVPLTAHVPIVDIATKGDNDGGALTGISNGGGGQSYFNHYLKERHQQLGKLFKLRT